MLAHSCMLVGATRIWHPAKIPGLLMWLDAGSLNSLANGMPVGRWPDSSGNGRNAGQSSSNARPVFSQSAAGGPSVLFDGTFTLLVDSPGVPAPRSAFALVRLTSAPVSPYPRGIVWGRASVATTSPQYGFGITLSGSNPVLDTSAGLTNCHVNGVATATVPLNANAAVYGENPNWDFSNGMDVGDAQGGSGAYIFAGYIAQILLFNRALQNAERQRLEEYFGRIYGP